MAEAEDRLIEHLESLTQALQAQIRAMNALPNATERYTDSLLRASPEVVAATTAVTKAKQQYKINSVTYSSLNSTLSQVRNETLRNIGQTVVHTARLNDQISIKQQEAAVIQANIDSLQTAIGKTQEEIDSTNQQIEIKANLANMLADSIAQNQQLINQTQQQIDQTTTEITLKEALIQSIRDNITSDTALLNASQSELDALNARVAAGEVLTAVEETRRTDLNSRISTLTDQLIRSDGALLTENAARDVLYDKLIDQDNELSQLNEVQRAARIRLEVTTEQITDLGNKASALGEQQEILKNEMGEQSQELELKTKEIKALKTERFNKILSTLIGELDKFVKAVRETQNKFGLAAGTAAKLNFQDLIASVKSTITSITSFGATAGVSKEEIAGARTSFQSEFGGVLTPEAAADIARQAKEMGVSTAELAKARRSFMTQTMGDTGKAKAAQDKFIGEFAKKGLSSKDAMEAIGKYSELLARNGTRFAGSFARAAADAKKIGVDLNKIDQVGDNIIGNFEGFLESQAELGAMGFGFDTSRLAELAESGDTGALMNELRTQLASTGKDITKLRRSEQLALSQAFGLSMEELQRMAGPTAGSGEETLSPEELQKDANKSLTRIVNLLESALWAFAGIAGTLTIIRTILAVQKGGGIGSTIASRFGFGGRGTPTTPTPPGAPTPEPAPGAPTGGTSFLSRINFTDLVKGAAALTIMAGALFLFAKAAQEFANVNWEQMKMAGASLAALTLAVVILGKVKGQVIAGALAMGIMGGALWVIGNALQQFMGLDWPQLGMAAASIVGLAVATGVLGLMLPTIVMGSIALAAMGAGFAVFATLVGATLPALTAGLVPFFDALNNLPPAGTLLAIGPSLAMMAGGLMVLAGALALFPTMELGRVTSRLLRLNKLNSNVSGITSFANALTQLNSVVKAFDTAKLAEINRATQPSLLQTVKGAVTRLGNFIGNALTGGGTSAPTTTTPSTAPTTSSTTPAVRTTAPTAPSTAGIQQAARDATLVNVPQGTPAAPMVNVDLSRLEAKLDGIIRVIGSIRVELDGNKVGKVLVDSSNAGTSVGVLRGARS